MKDTRPNRSHAPLSRALVLLGVAMALIAAGAPGVSADRSPAGRAGWEPVIDPLPGAYPHDDELRLNQVQVIGTHNSYHRKPHEAFEAAMNQLLPGLANAFQYEHRPLPEQFADLGIRQIELDIFADPEGGHYADRKAHQYAGLPADGGIEELHEPGMKVLHVQEVDVESTCWTFVSCLQHLEEWSDANPGHLPVMVLVEAKDGAIPDPFDMGFVDPIPFDAGLMDAVDAEIRSVFDDDRIITPDLVRGEHDTLPEALAADGWPTLGEVRGKVMFGLDNGGSIHDAYLAGRPAAQGRAMFPSAAPMGAPSAAFLKLNDPVGQEAQITAAVEAGYVVRTRADGDSVPGPAPAERFDQRDAALATGAQFVSTDFPEPDVRFGEDYDVVFDDGSHVRCNPSVGPEWCRTSDVEEPGRLGIPPPACDGARFADVGVTHTFCTEISWLADSGVTEGFPDGTFGATIPVSRQAFAAFLARQAGITPVDGPCDPPVSDVDVDHPFCTEIAWLLDQGIANGYSDGTFRSAEPVSRQAAAAFLVRAFGGTEADQCAGTFSDVGENHPFCMEIEALASAGIISGYGDGTFRPAAPVSRQALAAFLFRFSAF